MRDAEPRDGMLFQNPNVRSVRSSAGLLVASGVVKGYPSLPEPVVALDGVDLDVAVGEFVAVTGPSGSVSFILTIEPF